MPIDEVLSEINKIANKYVFITLFGPENQKMEKEFDKHIVLLLITMQSMVVLFGGMVIMVF